MQNRGIWLLSDLLYIYIICNLKTLYTTNFAHKVWSPKNYFCLLCYLIHGSIHAMQSVCVCVCEREMSHVPTQFLVFHTPPSAVPSPPPFSCLYKEGVKLHCLDWTFTLIRSSVYLSIPLGRRRENRESEYRHLKLWRSWKSENWLELHSHYNGILYELRTTDVEQDLYVTCIFTEFASGDTGDIWGHSGVRSGTNSHSITMRFFHPLYLLLLLLAVLFITSAEKQGNLKTLFRGNSIYELNK